MADDPVTTPSDKDENMAKLREQRDANAAEIARLQVFEHREIVRTAGFDPDSGKGKSLIRDLKSGAVAATLEDTSTVVEWADTEYDWQPEPTLTPTEQVQVDGQQRRESVEGVTVADQPPDILEAVQEAEAAGDFARARYLKNSVAINKMMRQPEGAGSG